MQQADEGREVRIRLPDAAATQALGSRLANAWPRPLAGSLWLSGALGAGKSELARAFLRALGVSGTVRSPTYTLVEPYATEAGNVLHMDCYRLGDAEELAMLGLEDSPPTECLWLIEWPERVREGLPAADVAVFLTDADRGRLATLRAQPGGKVEQVLQLLLE